MKSTESEAPGQGDHWVGAWASAQQLTEPQNLPPPPGLSNNTLRQIIHVSLGGTRIRIRFSNEFGDGPLTMRAVHVAESAGWGSIRPGSDRPLTFAGRASVTIPAGSFVVSNPVGFGLMPLSDVAITIYFGDIPGSITGHPGSRTTSYLLQGGAVTASGVPESVLTVVQWYVLSGVDVVATESAGAIVVLGDSITDGRGVTTDKNSRWPDNLARRLQANERTSNVALLNLGIGGNRILQDGLGPSMLSRFDRDVIGQSGVRWLVVLAGVNDIGTGPVDPRGTVARDVIAAFQEFVVRAHSHGIRVYGATLLPFGSSFYDTPGREAERQSINTWIRSSGGVLDGVIDMDAILRDPQEPLRLKAEADSGDSLHPQDEGYRMMADGVDLDLFAA